MGIVSATVAGSVGRLLLPPLLPTLIVDLGITRTQAGLSLTAMWGMTALFQFPGGRLSDGLSRKTVLMGGLFASISGFALVAVIDGFGEFLVAVVIVGVGAGLFMPAKYLTLKELFVARRSRAFGINAAGAEIGGILAAGLAVVALTLGLWQLAFLPVIVILVVVLVVLHRSSDGSYRIRRVEFNLRETVARVMGIRKLRRLLILFAAFAFVWQGLTSFVPDFLHVEKGFTQSFASNVFAILFVVGAIAAPVSGALGDKFGNGRVAIFTPMLATTGLVILLWFSSVLAIVTGIVLIAAGLGSFWPIMSVHLLETLPDDSEGGDFGAMRTAFLGIGSIGPGYVGSVTDFAGYVPAFLSLVVVLLLSTVLILIIAKDIDPMSS